MSYQPSLQDFQKLLFRVLNINQKIESIMATQESQVERVKVLTTLFVKIGDETGTLLQQIKEMKALIDAGAEASPALVAALDVAIGQAQKVDDMVPDIVPTEPTV